MRHKDGRNHKPVDVSSFKDDDFHSASRTFLDARRACVEVAVGPKAIAVRDSKNIRGGTLGFTRREWKAFIDGVKKGEFDI